MEDNIDTAKTTARSEFAATKPLPPIGATSEEADSGGAAVYSGSVGTDRSDVTNHDEDQKSISSSPSFDRRRESGARPRIVRGFRPEVMSDEEMENELAQRSVSFTNGPPVTSRRRTYDGREITFVTLNTQTDWDWVEKAEIANLSTEVGVVAGKEKAAASPRSASSKADVSEERIAPDTPQYQMPYSDEYGIPILDLSSDTDDSSDDEVSHKKIKDERTFMPSVGPPSILQYQRESEKQDIVVDDPESRLPDFGGPEYDKDDSGMTHGMFSGNCEFCNKPIKRFPTIEQQLKTAPEVLYCCDEYREFVEFILSTTNQMEEEKKKEHKLIDIKPHEHVGSKQERNAAKEKAVQRMRERELQRRQQEASGMQQNFFASGHGGTSKAGFMKQPGGPGGPGNVTMTNMFGNPYAVPNGPGGNTGSFARQMKTINYQLSSQKCLEEGWTLRAPSPLADVDGDDVFIPEPLNPAMLADGKLAMKRTPRQRPTPRANTEHHFTFRPVTSETSYELAQAYRPDSEFYRRHLRDRPLIEKFYESGQKFLTMFPDGTGNVFYPSGNLAILVSSIKLGQYYYTLHHDFKRSGVAAVFEPNGYGYCYFQNGDIRLYIDQYGGTELDNFGSRRRKWSWKDQVTHVHAPPFQPICIGLNRHMGVRVMSQENIAVTFSASKRSCRFNMGSKLKLVAPENAPLKEVEEEYIFLEEKKNLVDSLLNKVANLLKFPNNPKLDKMLPPLHITSRQNKTEKLKKERQIYLAQQSAREKKQPSIPVT